jgi:hypothetical protein
MHLYVFAYLCSAAAEVYWVLRTPDASLSLYVDTTATKNRHCDTVDTDELPQLSTCVLVRVCLRYLSLKLRPMRHCHDTMNAAAAAASTAAAAASAAAAAAAAAAASASAAAAASAVAAAITATTIAATS